MSKLAQATALDTAPMPPIARRWQGWLQAGLALGVLGLGAACGDSADGDSSDGGSGSAEAGTSSTSSAATETTGTTEGATTATSASTSATSEVSSTSEDSSAASSDAADESTDDTTSTETTDSGEEDSSGETEDPEDCLPFEIYCGNRCIVADFDNDYCGAVAPCEGEAVGESCEDGQSCVDGRCAERLDFDTPSLAMMVDGEALQLARARLGSGAAEILIWRTYVGRIGRLWGAIREGEGEFSQPMALAVDSEAAISESRVVAGMNQFHVAWVADEMTGTSLKSRHWRAEQGWSSVLDISDSPAIESDLRIAVHPSGDLYAVWGAAEGLDLRPRAARLVSLDEGWEAPVDPGSADDSSIAPLVAMGGDGSINVIWRSAADMETIWASRLNASLEPTLAGHQVTAVTVAVPHYALAADSQGALTMVWVAQAMEQRMSVKRLEASASEWTREETLTDPFSRDRPHTPHLVVDDDGRVTALWSEANGDDGRNRVWARRFVPGEGWGTPQQLGGRWFGGHQLSAVVDRGGQVTVAWWSPDRGRQHGVRASRFVPSQGVWSAASLIDDPSQGNGFEPKLLLGDDGRVDALWAQRMSTASTRFYRAVLAK